MRTEIEETDMQVLLDGKTFQTTAESVGDAIEAAAQIARDRGRSIIDVLVDGRRLSHRDLDSPHCMVQAADMVHLTSTEPARLVRESFLSAAAALDDINQTQQRAAELIQIDDVAGGMESLDQALSAWLAVQDVLLRGARSLAIDLNSVEIGPLSLGDAIGRLNRRLTEMADALRRKDVITLADTLLYEMPDIVESWKAILTSLALDVANAQARAGER